MRDMQQQHCVTVPIWPAKHGTYRPGAEVERAIQPAEPQAHRLWGGRLAAASPYLAPVHLQQALEHAVQPVCQLRAPGRHPGQQRIMPAVVVRCVSGLQ